MNIELNDNMILLDGKPFFVYSGEVHYFRIEKKYWRTHLLKAKKAGLNTISSYIPWCLHEKEEGKFNFDNFLSFIKLLKEMNLYFIARVGPISNAELLNEGLPQWLVENHPAVCISGKGLPNLPHVTLVSYHNPEFKEYTRRWYAQLLPIIKENQIINNGNIILVQLCNEIGMVHWVNKQPDYSQQTEKLYQQFLKDKNYTDISKVHQPENTLDEDPGDSLKNFTDWMYFYSWYYGAYYGFLYDLYKEQGIQLPVIANIPQFYDFDVRGRGVYSPMTTIMFKEFTRYVPNVIFGGAYQMRELDWENFHDIAITTEVIKMITSSVAPSICSELQTGILRDRPKIYSQDVELNLKTSTAHGLNGLNCYMFSGGKNRIGGGAFGSYHEWQAPVNSKGQEMAHFKPVELFGRFIKCFGEKLSQTKKISDTTIGFYPPYYATELLKGEFIDQLEIKRNLLFFDGIVRLLQLAGFNYNFIDLEKITTSELEKIPHMWVFSLEFMDSQTEQKLFEFVKSGGKLIIGPSVTQNIAKGFGFSIQETIKENIVHIDSNDVYVVDKVQIYSGKINRNEIIARTKNNLTCGIKKKIGSGEIIVFGFGITHIFNYHIDVIKYFADLVGIKQTVKLTNTDINATLRANDKFGFLFLHNYHREDKKVGLRLAFPGETKLTEIPDILMSRSSAQILPLNLPLNEQLKIRYGNVEVIGYKIDKKFLSLDIYSSSIYNAVIELKYLKKLKKINFSTNGGLQKKEVILK